MIFDVVVLRPPFRKYFTRQSTLRRTLLALLKLLKLVCTSKGMEEAVPVLSTRCLRMAYFVRPFFDDLFTAFLGGKKKQN
ncbi:hypothetical protein PC116_g29457 [Phytophthora cactorum]|nr:hypothetical protein PC116_g29457 [Phytophthora cactorum]